MAERAAAPSPSKPRLAMYNKNACDAVTRRSRPFSLIFTL